MLDRVLEPEVMDTLEEALDYDAMDHTEVNAQFVRDFLAAGVHPGSVLDLGTGTALIPIELMQQDPRFHVVAVEFSQSMLNLAAGHLGRLGLTEKIILVRADAKRLPFRDNSFPMVMSNSLVHHLAEPSAAFREAHRVVTPGGLLFFRDLVRPDNEDRLRWLVERYAGGATAHQQKLFADSLRASLTVEEVVSLIKTLGYSPETVKMTSDRHWTWQARKAKN